jgi:ketosteroid isomerase-like protein
MRRQIILAVVAAAVAVLHAAPAAAADRQDVIAVIQAFNTAGNKGDRSGYADFCTPDAVVVDHTPPYLFQGPTACAEEYDAVVAWGARNKIGVDDSLQKVFEPVFFEVQGDVAYAVFPVKAWFREDGHPQVESMYLTAVLRRQANKWRIASLAYSTLGWASVAAQRR